MKLRRLVIATLLSLAMVAATVSVAAPPASAGAANVPFAEYNICGRRCNSGDAGAGTVDDLLVWYAGVSPTPWTFSVNEVCRTQYNDLESRLEPKGYTGFFSVTLSNAGTNCDGSFGNAIFAIGVKRGDKPDDVAFFNSYYSDVNQLHGASTAEKRRLMCNDMGTFAFDYTQCVTHLVPDETLTFQKKQATQAHAYLAYVYGNYRRFVGGDFNLVPSAVPGVWSTDYREGGSTSYPTAPTPSPSRKIDYLWGSRNFTYGHAAQAPYCNSQLSDHCYYSTRFSFN